MRDIKEFQILDINAVSQGIDIFKLMENAGNKLAKHIIDFFPEIDLFLFICGKGNNAGDGYIAAQVLHDEGLDVRIINLSKNINNTAKKAFDRYEGEIVESSHLEHISPDSSLLIDCLLGSGIKGEPRNIFRSMIKEINLFPNILSVDVPSGFGKKFSVIPTQTLTFHDQKKGMNVDNCGEIFVTDIGISEKIDESCGPGELELFPKFVSDKHKGQNGKVAIVGGGEYAGAPAIAGMGAYRTGVDLVHIFVPDNNFDQVSSFAPELIVHNIGTNYVSDDIMVMLEKHHFDSIVIGPGMGKSESALDTVQEVINNFDNIVIDADAINNYDFGEKNVLLTPHKGELIRLKVNPVKEELMNFSLSSGATLLLKGEIDYITDGLYFKNNYTGHPRMAVGGTGDLLAGICGALLGKGLTAFECGRLASYVFGLAGERCYNENGPGFIPTDLALSVSKILGKL